MKRKGNSRKVPGVLSIRYEPVLISRKQFVGNPTHYIYRAKRGATFSIVENGALLAEIRS